VTGGNPTTRGHCKRHFAGAKAFPEITKETVAPLGPLDFPVPPRVNPLIRLYAFHGIASKLIPLHDWTSTLRHTKRNDIAPEYGERPPVLFACQREVELGPALAHLLARPSRDRFCARQKGRFVVSHDAISPCGPAAIT
jgi:hypothetical protein